MSELKSVAVWHPDPDVFARWYEWFSARGWMVIDVGDALEEVPEVGIWVIAWNEQFHRPKLRTEFQSRRRKFPDEVWFASIARSRFHEVSLDELSLYGLDDVFSDDPTADDFVEERLELALRSALLPASRHRIRNSAHLGTKHNLAEAISVFTGQLMRETDLKTLTFWLNTGAQGLRAWVRRSHDRIESLAGSVQMASWKPEAADKWGIPRRAKAHRWEMQTRDEMAWWVPLAYEHRIVGYLELVFPSSLSADIEMGTLRAREWAPALIAILEAHSARKKDTDLAPNNQSALEAAHLLIDCARRSQRPLCVVLIRSSVPAEKWLSKLRLRTSDLTVKRDASETLLVLPETTYLSALNFLTRISAVWNAFEHLGMAALHQHGISLEGLMRRAQGQPLWARREARDHDWAVYADTKTSQAMKHVARIMLSMDTCDEGKLLLVAAQLHGDSLVALSHQWSGIVVAHEIEGEIPRGWSWVRSTVTPSEVEIYVMAADGTYGFKGTVDSSDSTRPWYHTSEPRLVLHRWSQLTTQYLLGGEL